MLPASALPGWRGTAAKRALASLAASTLFLGVSGCGYTLARSDGVPDDVRTVHVRVEAPERTDPLLVDSFAREIRRVVRAGGRLKPVDDVHADADLVLKVTTDRTRAVAFDRFNALLDYQVTVAVDAELRRSDATILWSAARVAATRGQAAVRGAVVESSSSFQGTETVDRNALGSFDTVQLGEERKAAARDAVMRDIAETVYNRMIEGL